MTVIDPKQMNFRSIHHPVMLQEALEGLNIIPDGIYIDGTFGRGGHSREIVSRLSSKGKLFCLDKDPQAIRYAKDTLNDPRVSFIQGCFSNLEEIAKTHGFINKVNGILLDLGVSSPQLEDPSRGFSFMHDGPLDMRMDPTEGLSAKEWINSAQEEEISDVLKRLGEESFAKKIARNIIHLRKQKPIHSTHELAQVVDASLPFRQKCKRHPATKTFQAIRLYINQELQAIDSVLKAAGSLLASQGRFVIISFHSLEDRKVKNFFRENSRITLPAGVSIPDKDLHVPFEWIIKRQKASLIEVSKNPRSRSATLRAVEKKGS